MLFSFRLLITHSVVSMVPAIEAAFSNARRVTLAGSIIPSSNISTYSSVRRLKPCQGLPVSRTLALMPSQCSALYPALVRILKKGLLIACRRILYQILVELLAKCISPLFDSKKRPALSNAIPPPGRMPSCRAALVACSASSTLSFFSFISSSD